MDKIQELKKRFTGQIKAKEPMSLHTTLALGGPALAFTKARQEEDLVSAVKSAKVLGVKYMVIGDGSDLLISEKGFDGLVIEGTGLGHLPINEIDSATKEHLKIFDALKELIKQGTVVAMASQTIYGGIDMNVYATGRKLLEAGIIGNYCDMTPETAFIKLAWVLSNYPKEKAKEMFEKNIAGEISERLEKVNEK